MDRPHVLWVEIGFGIAIAAFAAIVVIGQQTSTAVYVGLLLGFLALFVAFSFFAEGAAHRAEHHIAGAAATRRLSERRRPASSA
jgi:high-affinity K+ transport system ATPase subunit B